MGVPTFCMQNTLHTFRTPQIPASQSQPQNHHAFGCWSLNLRQSLRWQKGSGLAVKCGDRERPMRSESSQKHEMKDEECEGMEEEEEEEEVSKEDVTEKVELMEMEALMGKDDGKEAMDYKRRAGIFYKSSEMFQAIKDDKSQPHPCT